MARHEHAHEVLGLAVAVLAGHRHVVDVLVVEVADGALDQRAFLVDQRGCGGAERQFAHALPEPHQVFVVALDLGLGARGAGGAKDDAHAVRHGQILGDLLETLAIGRIGDLARDAATPAGVGHKHRITACEGQVGGQGRALVAALLLDDLDQQDLAAFDDFLDLVLLALHARAVRDILLGVAAAQLLDDMVRLVLAVVLVRVIVVAMIFIMLRVIVMLVVLAGGNRLSPASASSASVPAVDFVREDRAPKNRLAGAVACRGDGLVTQDLEFAFEDRSAVPGFGIVVAVGLGFRGGDGGVVARALGGRTTTAIAALLLLLLFLALSFGVGFKQRLTVRNGDLVIIRVDFAEGQEAVAVAAIFHEGRLQRRLYAGYLCEIDIAPQLFAGGRLQSQIPRPFGRVPPRPGSLPGGRHR